MSNKIELDHKKIRKLLKTLSDVTVNNLDDFKVYYFYDKDVTELEKIASFLRKEIDEDTERFELTDLSSKCTGIGKTIFVKAPIGEHRRRNKFNLKLYPKQNTNNLQDMCMIIFDESGNIIKDLTNEKNQYIDCKTLEKLQKWIKLNIRLLIEHWYLEIDSIELDRNIKKLSKGKN